MKRIIYVGLFAVLLLTPAASHGAARSRRIAATCTGSTPCRACKNCRYCKHCAKEGGTCGVCRRRRAARQPGSWKEAVQRLATEAHSH